MSDDPQRIDLISAEHLLRGARSGSSADRLSLSELLAAAAAPARLDELAGEDAAVAAFRDAHSGFAPNRRSRRSMLKSILVKASAVAAVAVVGGGGVALAATTGHLPGTHAPDRHASAQPTHATAGATTSGHASRPAAAGTHGAAASHTARNGSPSPNMRGLCTAFRAHGSDNPGKALENPAFKALIARAGGKDNVAAYCATVLATPAGKASGNGSDASTHASSHAPSHPSSHAPTSRPTTPQPRHSTPSHPAPSATNTHRP